MLVLKIAGRMVPLVFLAACSRNSETVARAVDLWKRGEHTVVEPTAADFFEGQVLEVSAGHLRVQRVEGGENLRVAISDAYRIPSAAPQLPANAWAICELGPHQWGACRMIRSGLGGGQRHCSEGCDAGDADGRTNGSATPNSSDRWEALVVDWLGTERLLHGIGTVIEPTGLTAMNIQHRFEQSSRRATFERSIREAGRPRRQPNWQPSARQLVLANRQREWFGAQVVEVDKERVVVRWDAQSALTDFAREDVSPQPPACGTVTKGDRALRRPSGQGGAWLAVAVVAVDGTDATVEDADRNRTQLQVRDLCPLGQQTAGSGAAK